MSTHLLAWQESIDQASLGRINAVVDDVVTTDGVDRFFVPNDYNWIRWAMATGPSLSRAQVVAPSLTVKRMNLEVVPRMDDAELLDLAKMPIFIPARPISLVPSESIEFQTAEDGSSGTQQDGFVALGPEILPDMPSGDIRVARASGSTTLVARTWTTVSLTLDSSLEPGRYTLVGFLPNSATAVAARMLFEGQTWRPGMPGLAGAEDVAMEFSLENVRRVMWYSMGEFTHTRVPQIQFFATSTDSAQVVILYIIRTGDA